VLGFAYLFRLQSFLLSPGTSWQGMLKVDILNIMGVAMAGAAWCWARGRTEREKTLWLLVPAALCVLLSQYSPGWSWPNLLGDRLQGYIRMTPAGGNFMLFPWAGFVFIGAWLGRLLVINRDAAADRQFHVRLGLAGIAIFVAGYVGISLPTFTPHSTFWHGSTSFFLIRIGIMLLLLALSWLWMKRPRADRWSPMVLFGQTSLFVYWVHVEVVYGFPTAVLRHMLSINGALIAYALFTLFMLGLAIKWNQRAKGPLIPVYLKT